MKKKLMKLSVVAMASTFAITSLALADDESTPAAGSAQAERGEKGKGEAGASERPERPARPERGGSFDRAGMLDQIFDRLDADKSGGISEKEYEAAGQRGGAGRPERPEGAGRPERPEGAERPERPEGAERPARPEGGGRPEGGRPARPEFKEVDADGSGEISKEELGASFEKRRAQAGGARGEGRGQGRGAGDAEKGGSRRPALEDDKS